jgi:hypothetical protein
MSSLPRAFHQIRLELAREPSHPQGDAKSGYLITAPLDADKHLDASLWKSYRDNCRVVRFRENDKDVGHLVHGPGGNWSFRYDIAGDNADETGFNLQKEKFVTGEYISVREGDLIHTYLVTSVERL